MTKPGPKESTELKDLLYALHEAENTTEFQAREEYAASGFSYSKQVQLLDAALAQLVSRQSRERLIQLKYAASAAPKDKYSSMRQHVRSLGLSAAEIVKRLISLQPAIANRDFVTWSHGALEVELADVLVLADDARPSATRRPARAGTPTEAAEEICRQYSMTEPRDILLDAVARGFGIDVLYEPLEGAAARLTVIGDRGCITVDTRGGSGRARFSLAHELGHYVLHREHLCMCSEADLNAFAADEVLEREANEFAAALTMPAAMLSERIRGRDVSLALLRQIADDFKTSITASALRYSKLSDYSCAVVMCREGEVEWQYRNQYFEPRVRDGDLDSRSIARHWFDDPGYEELEARVAPGAWLDTKSQREDAELFEMVVPMPTFRSALVILWLATW